MNSIPGIQIPIARPPWKGVGKQLESLVRKALYDFKLIENKEHIALALSGGKDSLALLYLLHAISGRGFQKFKITAIHVDGEFSCGAGVSLGYISGICKALEVPLIVKTSSKTLDNLECYSCSRERRSHLFDAAKSVGADTVAFGHHRDDNAETLLMNLMHKGEFAGMLPKVPMIHYGVNIIRPLIYASEEKIISFAKQCGFMRITCQCPVGQNSKRKQVDTLIDQMEELYPNVRKNLSSASLNYGSDKALKI